MLYYLGAFFNIKSINSESMVEIPKQALVAVGSALALGMVFGMDKACHYIGDSVVLPGLKRLSNENPEVRKAINYAALGESMDSAYQSYLKGWNEGFHKPEERRPKTFDEFKRYVESEDLLKDR